MPGCPCEEERVLALILVLVLILILTPVFTLTLAPPPSSLEGASSRSAAKPIAGISAPPKQSSNV